MKSTVLGLLLAAFLSSSVLSQSGSSSQSPEFDHTAVYVHDLQKSADFYDKVLGLEKIPEPFHDGRHVWYRLGAHEQLHVISGATAAVEHDINGHLAFRVAALADFLARLDRIRIPYLQRFRGDGKAARALPHGAQHVYFQDPDGSLVV